jgi:glc operon protein GlcG
MRAPAEFLQSRLDRAPYSPRMRTTKRLLLTLTASLAASLTAAEPPLKLDSRPVLTLAIAQKMAAACVQHQRENQGPPLAIAVYDDGAKLLYFLGMDGISSGTGPTAMRKGESAARFRVSTAQAGSWVQSNPGVGHVPGLLGIRGGLPIITAGGRPLGGIGVSGAPSEVDEKCAQVGIDAVAAELRGG